MMLRRAILLLVVAAVMAAMMVVLASPAFAKGPSDQTCAKIARSAEERGHGAIPRPCF